MEPKRKAVGGQEVGGSSVVRERLLGAAVDCLIDLGVAGTTTLAVQRRAQVSRGALLHYFPSRAALLAASVTELVRRNEQAVALSLAQLAKPKDRLEAAVNALAFAARQPAYLAELELWAVARTDAALKHTLILAERTARRDIERVSAELFGMWAEAEAYTEMIALTQHFMRGLAISENLGSSPARRKRLIAAWTQAMRLMLGRRAGASRATG
ncbi:TetR/AcrR family transcriptional regulator [Chelatococcus reniformis]|uniref:HTH tetR-type domain-containing protein n=1 Tax=Chelatococcus reniformis TaxID=1494448 RepID=A0A916UTK3_9HYPH|nr:TetR/AcrR family transcriptional regulator [Chelatococcus reniformis]GGC86193.1 hypothetical protein GCM10010994_50110 [Chelatococcus reniformis]